MSWHDKFAEAFNEIVGFETRLPTDFAKAEVRPPRNMALPPIPPDYTRGRELNIRIGDRDITFNLDGELVGFGSCTPRWDISLKKHIRRDKKLMEKLKLLEQDEMAGKTATKTWGRTLMEVFGLD